MKKSGLKFKRPSYNIFEKGGIITGGTLHSEYNELGDRGVPVILTYHFEQKGDYDKNKKLAEIERGEIIIRKNYAREIEDLINEYNNCNCPIVLLKLGKLTKFIIDNLSDKQCDLNGICLLT
jgi:hypothetical protein